jgi:hypothetical protein
MLAYVFWHRPGSGVARDEYERALAAFHRALAAEPPPGFRRSVWHRFEAVPWLGAGGPGYEDWYLVDDWPAVGEIERGAVTGTRREPHDGVAVAAAEGAGAVYGLVSGPDTALDSGRRAWFEKPAGLTYAELDERLAAPVGGSAAIWRRRLVLGPAPENCVAGAEPATVPAGFGALEAAGAPALTE